MILDDALMEHIASLPRKEAEKWLILEPHSEFDGYWEVNSLGRHFRFDLEEIITTQRVVSPANLEEFLAAAKGYEYEVAWGEPPERILDAYSMLNVTPEVEINSDLPGTINGLLPFQVRGYNKVKDVEGSAAVWSTGTGKSVLQAALVKYHLQRNNFDICFLVCKGHNKINTQRSLKALAGLDSYLLDGSPSQREALYAEMSDDLIESRPVIVVTNYEKFRDDFVEFFVEKGKKHEKCRLRKEFNWFFTGKVFCVWDEMPTKLKNRTSKLYRAVATCLYDSPPAPKVVWEKKRPSELRQIMLSATPIENDPGDFFNCERILNGGRTYGTVMEFENRYVARYSHWDRNKPEKWHRLDELNLRGAHMMYIVDKDRDPEIAAQFPGKMSKEIVIDWTDYHRSIYDKAQDLAKMRIDEAEEEGEPFNPFGLIAVLKMLCAMPSSLGRSATTRLDYEEALKAWDGEESSEPRRRGSEAALQLINALGSVPKDDGHTKLLELQDIVLNRHRNDKVVCFSSLNYALIPRLCEHLDSWGVTYVRYGGSLTQKQAAEDAFKSDDSIQMFVSSDEGSDSINLQVAPVVINYDLPLKASTKTQRVNRVHRITSGFETTWSYDLNMANSVDERWAKLIEKKQAYHDAVFRGAALDSSLSANMTKNDLLYVLGY